MIPTETHVSSIMRTVSELPLMPGWPDHVAILAGLPSGPMVSSSPISLPLSPTPPIYGPRTPLYWAGVANRDPLST